MNIHSCTVSIKGKEIIITLENSNLEKKYKKQQFNSFTKRGISDLFT